MSDLDKSTWITLEEPSEPWAGAPDTREWEVLMRPWGTNDMYAVGPFPSWGDAEKWIAQHFITHDSTILGIAERRRPKGDGLAPRRRPRSQS